VTINVARLGYLFRGNQEGLLNRLGQLMDMAKDSLEAKRIEIQNWMDLGLYPYTKRYLGHLNNHFSTIGLNGVNEAIRNFTNDQEDITSEFGGDFAENVLVFMRQKLVNYQEETGNLYNLD
jgi:ribonucleoside-triphosphate reductase